MKRTLTLKPGAAGIRLALFSGSGLLAPEPEVLAYLRDTHADVFVVLGGLGRSKALAAETARALQSLQRLVLIVRGGADSFELETDPLLLDASALRSIRIGQDSLVPWPGADQGRYALDAAHCGFGEADLEAALEELGPREPAERRWLLSWQAPEPGSALSSFIARAGIHGAFSAWPPHPELESEGLRRVPRAWGPLAEGLEGQPLPPAALVLYVDRDGPRVER